jgi:hypothetical protein
VTPEQRAQAIRDARSKPSESYWGNEWASFLRDFNANAAATESPQSNSTARRAKIQALAERGATAGERAAATAALKRFDRQARRAARESDV